MLLIQRVRGWCERTVEVFCLSPGRGLPESMRSRAVRVSPLLLSSARNHPGIQVVPRNFRPESVLTQGFFIERRTKCQENYPKSTSRRM